MPARAAGGLEILCFADSSVSSSVIYFNGWPELDEMKFVEAYLRPGDDFVDGGANIGLYTLLAAAKVGPEGTIDAFEPSPRAARRLRRNVAHNSLTGVRIHEAALGDAPGTEPLLVGWDVSDRLASTSDLARGGQTVPVPTVRLDDILERGRHYAMAKLDLEGAELRCLRGAEARLRAADPPVWQIELTRHLLEKQGTTPSEVVDFLDRRGYCLAVYDSSTRRLRFLDHTSAPPPNVLAIARSAAPDVLRRLAGGTAFRPTRCTFSNS